MTEEVFQELKDEYINHLKEMIIEHDGLHPTITIFADHLEDDDAKGAIVHLPIPSEYMESEESKDDFIDNILPKIAVEVKKKFTVHAVVWCSEGWLRVADKLEEFSLSNTKEEVVIITTESETANEAAIYKIIRKDMTVTDEGKLITPSIELEKNINDAPLSIGGRFTGLFKKFKDNV